MLRVECSAKDRLLLAGACVCRPCFKPVVEGFYGLDGKFAVFAILVLWQGFRRGKRVVRST